MHKNNPLLGVLSPVPATQLEIALHLHPHPKTITKQERTSQHKSFGAVTKLCWVNFTPWWQRPRPTQCSFTPVLLLELSHPSFFCYSALQTYFISFTYFFLPLNFTSPFIFKFSDLTTFITPSFFIFHSLIYESKKFLFQCP